MESAYKETVEMLKMPVKYFIAKCEKDDRITANPHWHDAVEIIFVIEGQATQQIDENIFIISKNDIVIIWGNQIHATYSAPNEVCEMKVLQFKPEDVQDFNQTLHFTNCINKENQIYNNISEIINFILCELKEKDSAFQYAVKSAVYQFYTLIVRNISILPAREDKINYKKDIVIRILEYINNNYQSSITLESISSAFHLSCAQFMRIFKEGTGMTFKYYLNFYRIEKSLNMLAQGESVTKTAGDCGFENINTFIRLFKQHKHLTPTQYKNCFGIVTEI